MEWNIGEPAGLLAASCLDKDLPPQAVHDDEALSSELQSLCIAQGIGLEWPAAGPEDRFVAFDKRVLGLLPPGAMP